MVPKHSSEFTKLCKKNTYLWSYDVFLFVWNFMSNVWAYLLIPIQYLLKFYFCSEYVLYISFI